MSLPAGFQPADLGRLSDLERSVRNLDEGFDPAEVGFGDDEFRIGPTVEQDFVGLTEKDGQFVETPKTDPVAQTPDPVAEAFEIKIGDEVFDKDRASKALEFAVPIMAEGARLQEQGYNLQEMLKNGMDYQATLKDLEESPEKAQIVIMDFITAAVEKHGDKFKIPEAELRMLDPSTMTENERYLMRQLQLSKQETQRAISAAEKIGQDVKEILEEKQVSAGMGKHVESVKKALGVDVNPSELLEMMKSTKTNDPITAYKLSTWGKPTGGAASNAAGGPRNPAEIASTADGVRYFDPSDPSYSADDIYKMLDKGMVPLDDSQIASRSKAKAQAAAAEKAKAGAKA